MKKNKFNLQKPVIKLNNMFHDVIDNISYGSNKSDSSRQRELVRISSTVDEILGDEIGSLKSFTGDDIGVFLTKLMNEYDTTGISGGDSLDDFFSKEDQSIFEVFKARNADRNMLYDDLESIHDYLYELQEAINTTRDSILTADDFSSSISRSIKFMNSSENDTTIDSYLKEIELLETRFKLPQKLKEHICPNTLKYGTYYVYAIPYSKLFEDINRKKASSVTESCVIESFTAKEATEFKNISNVSGNTKEVEKAMNDVLGGITVSNSDISLPLIENAHVDSKFINDIFKPETIKTKGSSKFSDGVVDKDEKFDGVKDCYIEYISPKKMFKVKLFKKTIGYYYIHDEERLINTTTKNIFSTNNTVSKEVMVNDVEKKLVSNLSSKILKSFNKKFLEENIEMKELIANALIFNDLYKKKLHFQFIPAEYITEFKVNTNLDDEGESILKASLFNAKLYLGIMVFKITSILTKSNDTRITYVRNSGMDKNISKQVQNIARDVKSKQLNFKDLFSNSMMGKAGSAKDIYMPVGKSGERGLEFDILSGQQIDLNTDLTDKLRSGYITATGVPSVMMNYINEADYVKTLVMANAKYVSRVISYQLDFNASLTELYKKITSYCTNIPDEMIRTLVYSLSPPRSANMNNMVDLFSNTDQMATSIVKIITGENADQSDEDNKVKDYLYSKIMKDNLSMLEWSKYDEFMKDARIEAKLYFSEKEAGNNKSDENEY